ncbi:hypothetical protein BDW02DRAFT_565672 [Decorospora gaudefroyi]|uniref:Uncharacterized protein n=1 Tax=Decorospora gaudefroyi TaxID=184978 RepID=A0A6A5KP46_9PLEO|nr:hypothetical protein BDW02DRAFT_565672 [Decorospora gaudefroyi]
MHCEFDCVVANQRIKRAENDAIALPPILSNPSPPTLPATGSTTGSSLPYAPGHCSFHLQLFSQCLHTPTAGWHTQTLGMIHSIQDNNRETVATYPEGAGRIDDRAVALTGIGELRIGYDTKVEEVFFAFDKVGGWWSTGTKDAEGIMGLCEWGAWTRPQGKCDESVSEHPRLSGMTCLFRC